MPTDDPMQRLARQFADQMTPEQRQSFLSAVLNGRTDPLVDSTWRSPRPTVRPAPKTVRGFTVRLDLLDSKPPVWRRLELPGDITLDRLHLVIQTAMGWLDSHLHRFRMGGNHSSPYFVTQFDLTEGDEDADGVPEDEVRLDQVISRKGDRLWYEYDFGDGWDHRLTLEAVTDQPPPQIRCTAGRLACPPEDCGGVWAYTELAAWVRGGYDPAALPSPFDSVEDARDWLPPGWDPDRFDLDEANAALDVVLAEPVTVSGELGELVDRLELRGNRSLTLVLARPGSHEPAIVGGADAAHLLEPFTALLDVIGDGVRLTGAGYLPPAVVEQVAAATGISAWWIGKANREDQTAPVADLRAGARALGLLGVRGGRLAPTAVARQGRGQPLVLWEHIVSRLPLGRSPFDRQAGWVSLAVVGSGAPVEQWNAQIRDLMFDLGWRPGDPRLPEYLFVDNPTLQILEMLAGRPRTGRVTTTNPAVAATARAAIRLAAEKR